MRVLKRGSVVVIWVLTVFETASMVGVGIAKFTNWSQWSEWFAGWGYATWFTAIIGLAEMAGGVTLLVPRLAAYAASGLIVVMVGAFYTTATKPNELGWAGAVIHLIVLFVILAARWPVRWRGPVPP